MHLRSIRFRLTLWYSLVVALGLALLGGFIWLAMRHQLYADVDGALRSRTQALEAFLRDEASDSASQLHDEVSEFARALPPEYSIAVSDALGAAIYQTAQSEDLLRMTGSSDDNQCVSLTDGGKEYRVFDHTAVVSYRRFRVLMVDDVHAIERVLGQLGLLLFTAIPGVVLIAALGGYLLGGRALAPVAAMTGSARSIGIENLSARLAVPATDDEIQHLAETWNEMLSRLEQAVTRISQFTSDASHELRTPIALIRSTAEIALRRPRSDEQYRQSLEQVEAESERMTQLVEDLLFLARADEHAVLADMGPVDLRKVVADASAEVAPRAMAKGIAFTVCAGDGPIPITGRESALRRMFLALLDNALKYTPAGGAIDARAEAADGNAVVLVSDTGIGIPEAALPHIFERFFRADVSRSRESGGHGLGLSIAQTIARQHNGMISAQSKLDKGSEFRVVLPA